MFCKTFGIASFSLVANESVPTLTESQGVVELALEKAIKICSVTLKNSVHKHECHILTHGFGEQKPGPPQPAQAQPATQPQVAPPVQQRVPPPAFMAA